MKVCKIFAAVSMSVTAIVPGSRRGQKILSRRKVARVMRQEMRHGKAVKTGHDKRSPRQS